MMKSYWDCREHLIDLLRCYGNRFMLVMINQEGKEIKLFAKSFVRQQLLSISRFLNWFAIWQRPVPDRLIRGLEKRRYQEPGQLDLFKEKVEKHNEKYAGTLEEEDNDEIESEDLCTEMPEGTDLCLRSR